MIFYCFAFWSESISNWCRELSFVKLTNFCWGNFPWDKFTWYLFSEGKQLLSMAICVQITDFALLDSPKSILPKIWMIEKSWNLTLCKHFKLWTLSFLYLTKVWSTNWQFLNYFNSLNEFPLLFNNVHTVWQVLTAWSEIWTSGEKWWYCFLSSFISRSLRIPSCRLLVCF